MSEERLIRRAFDCKQDQGLTAGNEDKEDEMGEAAAEAAEGGKGNGSGPGALAERPMGDAPAPKNKELADQPAPTFVVSLKSLQWT